MTDRDLIKKLGNLREIKPDTSWLKANRDSLFTQISNSGATNSSAWSSFFINFQSALKTASAPAIALASLMLFVVTSSAYGHLLLAKTKPNQSLYIAREISEQAKLTTIFNSDDRDKMAGQFAASNAQDITTVLADPSFDNKEEIAALNVKFEKEMKTVRKSVARLEKPVVQEISTVGSATGSTEVFSATLKKDETGVSLAGTEVNNEVVVATTSTTTKILEEAKTLFDEKKYTEALDKLKEVNDLIK